MPEIKVGDRVTVAPFDGVVAWAGADITTGADCVDIAIDSGTPPRVIEYVPAALVTVTPPPVAVPDVLDVLTHYTIKALPAGSVVMSVGGVAAQLRIDSDGFRYWHTTSHTGSHLSDATVAAWPAHVLHIGATR